MPSRDYLSFRARHANLFAYKLTNPFLSPLIFPSLRHRIRTICVDRILTTRRIKRQNCGISTSRRGKVRFGSSGRMRGFWLVWNRRSKLRRIGCTTRACAGCSVLLRVREPRRRRWRGRRRRTKGDLGGSRQLILVMFGIYMRYILLFWCILNELIQVDSGSVNKFSSTRPRCCHVPRAQPLDQDCH